MKALYKTVGPGVLRGLLGKSRQAFYEQRRHKEKRLRRWPDRALVHHSDRGLQYCSKPYTELLKANKVAISMTEKSSFRTTQFSC